MKKDMPLEGLRWSRDSGSALYDTPPNGRSRTGCGGVKLDHPHYTHINAKYIGKNFQTKHNVTIGSNHNGLPIIGDNCFVGCGAAILGPITIGK